MFVLTRGVVYAALFIWLFLLLMPRWLGFGAAAPDSLGAPQIVGLVIGKTGLVLIAWCVWNFAAVGKGTPAVFDAPRRLVATGPYRHVRNPMYLGGALVMLGSAIYFQSWSLLLYAAGFFALSAAMVVLYEEPHLRRIFGESYMEYTGTTARWMPRLRSR